MSQARMTVGDEEGRQIAADLTKRSKAILAGKAQTLVTARRRQSGIVYYLLQVDENRGSFTHESYESRTAKKIADGKTDFDRWFPGFVKSVAGERFADDGQDPIPEPTGSRRASADSPA